MNELKIINKIKEELEAVGAHNDATLWATQSDSGNYEVVVANHEGKTSTMYYPLDVAIQWQNPLMSKKLIEVNQLLAALEKRIKGADE